MANRTDMGGAQPLFEEMAVQAATLEEVSRSLRKIVSSARKKVVHALDAEGVREPTRPDTTTSVASLQLLSETLDRLKANSVRATEIACAMDEMSFQTNCVAVNLAGFMPLSSEGNPGFVLLATEFSNFASSCTEAARYATEKIQRCVWDAEAGVAITEIMTATLEEIDTRVDRLSEASTQAVALTALVSTFNFASDPPDTPSDSNDGIRDLELASSVGDQSWPELRDVK